MKCYKVRIRYTDGVDIQTQDTVIGCLEDDYDRMAYGDEDFERLLEDVGYADDDIYFYLDVEKDGKPYAGMVIGNFPNDCDAFCITAVQGEIDKNVRWQDYCQTNQTDSMYFYNGETFAVISEGDGSNLDWDDEEDGFVDYWYADVYKKGIGICGGGILLLREYISGANQTLEEIIEFLRSEKDMFEGIEGALLDCMMSPDKGEELEEEFENEQLLGCRKE